MQCAAKWVDHTATTLCSCCSVMLQRAVAVCCCIKFVNMYPDNNESKKNWYRFDVLFGSSTITHITFPDRILISFKYKRRVF